MSPYCVPSQCPDCKKVTLYQGMYETLPTPRGPTTGMPNLCLECPRPDPFICMCLPDQLKTKFIDVPSGIPWRGLRRCGVCRNSAESGWGNNPTYPEGERPKVMRPALDLQMNWRPQVMAVGRGLLP